MNIWLTNLAGLILLALVVWWFWFSKPKARVAAGAGPIDIVVDNGVYTPARIQVPTGRPVTLRFIRNDPSPCAEKVLFDDFGVAADLAVGKPTEITITP
ncbi:MAG: cupredoxin domain-containing protein, partial [Gammaproteobacteria bacterium]|nr:cupredoxin domain-containing protein [Gammaproteobacteria bacterium]